jgi:hypothetical protein
VLNDRNSRNCHELRQNSRTFRQQMDALKAYFFFEVNCGLITLPQMSKE